MQRARRLTASGSLSYYDLALPTAALQMWHCSSIMSALMRETPKVSAVETLERQDYYTRLGVARDATTKDITAAFRALSKKHHPDLGGPHEIATLLGQAYEALSDAGKRAAYDRNLPPLHRQQSDAQRQADEQQFWSAHDRWARSRDTRTDAERAAATEEAQQAEEVRRREGAAQEEKRRAESERHRNEVRERQERWCTDVIDVVVDIPRHTDEQKRAYDELVATIARGEFKVRGRGLTNANMADEINLFTNATVRQSTHGVMMLGKESGRTIVYVPDTRQKSTVTSQLEELLSPVFRGDTSLLERARTMPELSDIVSKAYGNTLYMPYSARLAQRYDLLEAFAEIATELGITPEVLSQKHIYTIWLESGGTQSPMTSPHRVEVDGNTWRNKEILKSHLRSEFAKRPAA